MVSDTVDIKKIQDMFKDHTILVGFIDGQPHANSTETVSDIARKLSYGYAGSNNPGESGGAEIPARPFLEEGMLADEKAIQTSIGKYYENVIENKSSELKGLARIAVTCVGAVKKFVYSDYYKTNVPNDPSTIKKKTVNGNVGDKPLIDSAQMINSLTALIDGKSMAAAE